MIKPFCLILAAAVVLAGCGSPAALQPTPQISGPGATPAQDAQTPIPTRPAYDPGQLVDYLAQSGDSLPALAAHFNTTVHLSKAEPNAACFRSNTPNGYPKAIKATRESAQAPMAARYIAA